MPGGIGTWPLIQVHLHVKPVGGTLKCLLKTGACLIEVATNTGATVYILDAINMQAEEFAVIFPATNIILPCI